MCSRCVANRRHRLNGSPHYKTIVKRGYGRVSWIRTSEMQESKSCALPLGDNPILAERVGFEPTVGCPITSFQGWLLKPLGHLSVFPCLYITASGNICQVIFPYRNIKETLMLPLQRRCCRFQNNFFPLANFKFIPFLPILFDYNKKTHSTYFQNESKWVRYHLSPVAFFVR